MKWRGGESDEPTRKDEETKWNGKTSVDEEWAESQQVGARTHVVVMTR